MREIKGVHHIGIRVRCLETAGPFYENLGFRFIAGPVVPEPVAIMIHPLRGEHQLDPQHVGRVRKQTS